MTTAPTDPCRVHVVVPEGLDDPTRPSGGNEYDRRVCAGLAATGWAVREHHVSGGWPHPRPADRSALAETLREIPTDSIVLVDGLVASAAPRVLLRYADRLRLVVLVHLPLGVGSPDRRRPEAAMLARVDAVVTTSAWTRDWLVRHAGLAESRVHVARPGTDSAALGTGSPTGGALLCVGAVTPVKGHDLLVAALARTGSPDWRCVCVGSLDVDPAFAQQVRAQAAAAGLDGRRLSFTGPLTGADLDTAYRSADLLVVPSRAETYGMVVTEALARGVPVLAARAGGVPEALGHAPDGTVPGLLVAPDDPGALAAALGTWLEDPACRARARTAALARRRLLPTWQETTTAVGSVLAGLASSP